ncbi:MAG TPA: hypothetical protein VHO71_02390, partial [Caproiciproducens sp.]|nr:hypothetical protein [Caproiciproducens sp.]
IIAIGSPGAKAGIYVNGTKILVATAETVPVVKSDTTSPVKVKAGASYTFKLTADAKPTFVAGSSSVFRVDFIRAQGKDYFFRITAIGKTGATCGFYINGQRIPVTTATVA